MLTQISHVLYKHILVFVACTVVENHVMKTFFRGLKSFYSGPETIEPLTCVTTSICNLTTLAIVGLGHFICCQYLTYR